MSWRRESTPPWENWLPSKMTILCGRDHRSPLEVLNWGHRWLLMLDQQGYGARWYPACWSQVDLTQFQHFWRRLDWCHRQHAPIGTRWLWQRLWEPGLALISPDSSAISTRKINCTCIRLNFNPSMYNTLLCFEGRDKSITPKILAKLFPEMDLK